jgi:hypothetical protein
VYVPRTAALPGLPADEVPQNPQEAEHGR